MNKKAKERFLFFENLVNGTSTPDAPQALPPNEHQHRKNIVSSASERRIDLTPSRSGISFGSSAASGQFGSTPSGGPSFGSSAASGQFGSTPSGGPSFGSSATSDQSGFGANRLNPSLIFRGSAASGQFGSTPVRSFSFGSSATSGQFGFDANHVKPNESFGDPSALNQSGLDVNPNQPSQPRKHPWISRAEFDKVISASKEKDMNENLIDLVTKDSSKDVTKRGSDGNDEENAKKKIKPSEPSKTLPQFAGKGLFQYIYSILMDSTGKTGVKQTNKQASDIYDKTVKARRTYLDKLAIAFKQNCLQNGVTRGSSFDKKRNALAKRLSEIPNMCTDKEDDWTEPEESHESLFK